jgi:dipeptidyl-peptidase-4
MTNVRRALRRRIDAPILAIFCLAAAALGPAPAQTQSAPAEKKQITLEMLYGPGALNFSGSYATGMTWLPDGEHYLLMRDDELKKIGAKTDAAEPAFDSAALAAALQTQGDFDEDAVRRISRNPRGASKDRQTALITHKDRQYLYRFEKGKLKRITESAATRLHLTLSPKAGFVAFVRDNNLFTVEVAAGVERQLTSDGAKTLLNGVLDWVYQEEVYGRGTWRAYWWRDDDAYIAYLQLDETNVPVMRVIDHVPVHPVVDENFYPKAGDPNPTVKLGVVKPTGGATMWVDLSKYKDIEFLIVRVGWTPDGKVIYQVQDREQRWLDLNEADPESGESRMLFRETSPAWVDVLDEPHWLADRSFLWRSARDGYRHLYHYARDGKLIRRVTEGPWEVRDLHGVDETSGWVYFNASKETPAEDHAYRVKLGGGTIERLTTPGASHSVNFDPTFRYFFDTFSNLTTPPKVHLRRADGTLERVISENDVTVLSEYEYSPPELMRVPARDGLMLNAILVRPTKIEPGRKYPIFSTTYGGPHAPSVHNRWGSGGGMFAQFLAQRGIATWVCDPRSASGESTLQTWSCYKQLGVSEVADLEDGVRFLADKFDWVDPARVALDGWSYGGFMVCYALTHSDVFSLGIAGGSVTDWRNYDTIYTERYMLTPEHNPDGYERASAVNAAKSLNGRLILVHGTMDDNVHLQNTLQLVDQLQSAGKMFELMLYPKNGHGIGHNRQHWNELRVKTILERL